MGNCIFKGFGVIEVDEMVKIVTTNGGIMELYAPITAQTITDEFPGHGIYRSNNDLFSPPLPHNEELRGGYFYYLLPLNTQNRTCNPNSTCVSSPVTASKVGGPYRMSFDNQRLVKRSTEAAAEVFPRYNNSGVWKVKLVINPEQLAEIMGEEARTEELIESVRTVAKCGNGNGNRNRNGNGVLSSSLGNSDQWSVCSSSSSRKGSV